MTDIMTTFGSELTNLVIWLIFAALGYGVKKLANRILDTKEKKIFITYTFLFYLTNI